MKFDQVVWFTLGRLAAGLAIGLLIGWSLGNVLLGVALVLAAFLAWHLVHLFWLDHWLKNRGSSDPPDVRGIWGDVVSQVVRLHRRKRFHKERLLQVFRELRQSTAAMPDGVLIINAQAEVVWFNRTAGRLLDLKSRVDRGIRITNLLRDPSLRRYLEHPEGADPVIVTLGQESLSFQVVPYSAGQRLLLVRDVTRQMALETMRQDFVANASHELRTPLTVVTGYLETLIADVGENPELRAPLEEMQRQTLRMNGIVGDLLDLSRLDAQTSEAAMREIDVAALCAVISQDLKARLAPVKVVLDIDAPLKLLGEEAQIHSAFSNLVDNAVKFTVEGGLIWLRWSVDGDGRARFSVEDQGPGIAPEHLPRLTERFYRADSGRARERGGTGLGLAIVKHVLGHHGASLEVQSTLGKGSTFSCVFPAARLRRRARDASDPALPRAVGT
jgi:two-component system, OmpR family, phosphate regulon sensor histidine kinase PhoR